MLTRWPPFRNDGLRLVLMFSSYYNNSVFFYAGLQLSISLQVKKYPCTVLLVFSGARTRLVTCLEGRLTPDRLLQGLRRAVNEHSIQLSSEQADFHERVRACPTPTFLVYFLCNGRFELVLILVELFWRFTAFLISFLLIKLLVSMNTLLLVCLSDVDASDICVDQLHVNSRRLMEDHLDSSVPQRHFILVLGCQGSIPSHILLSSFW